MTVGPVSAASWLVASSCCSDCVSVVMDAAAATRWTPPVGRELSPCWRVTMLVRSAETCAVYWPVSFARLALI